MPNTTTNTSNRSYPLPTAGNDLSYDVAKLILALTAIDADVATAFSQIAAKAGLASPAFSGTPTAPTAAPGTNTGQLATTAFVVAAISSLVNAAPGALDTLSELATALGNDANFAATMTTALAGKVPFSIIDTDTTMAANSDAKLASQKAVKAYIDAIAAAKASLTGAETLTNKTLTSPVLNTPSLILKQSASPTPTAEGDTQWDTVNDRMVIGDGAGQKIINPNDWVKIGQYSPSSVASLAITNLGAFKFLRLVGSFSCSTAATSLAFRVSADNGSTWLQSAEYGFMYTGQANAVTGSNAVNLTYGLLSATSFQSGTPRMCTLEFSKWNAAVQKHALGRCLGLDSNGQNAHYMHGARMFGANAVALNALQLFPVAGTFSGDFYLEGMK